MQLLTYPSLVESPFISVSMGGYTFGAYDKKKRDEKNYGVTYPNYIKSMTVTKINGALNTYTISMEYQISAGQDPNLIDKIISASHRNIEISYGDYSSPTMIYAKEKALITRATSRIDFASSKIQYTLNCVSQALKARSVLRDFPAYYDKPSNIIRMIANSAIYGTYDIFPGMRNLSDSVFSSLVASNDATVQIEAKNQISILDYLNYLVSCMTTIEDKNSKTKQTRFYLTICDDNTQEFNGAYFKVIYTTLNENVNSINKTKLYEVEIGYPTNDLVTQFDIQTNDTWAILYETATEQQGQEYNYRIDDEGNIVSAESSMITNDRSLFKTTQSSKTWWSNMTSYPIKATMTVKGLLRPLMLMSYVYIKAYFYGRKHTASGLYIITQQQDTIDQSGYKSTLSLQRIGGDEY